MIGSARTPSRHIGGPEDFQAAFGVSRETLARLSSYFGLLARWQKTINLVAPNTVDDAWHRHFADSAQITRYLPEGTRRIVDLGSGAGFPGLVLAVLLAGGGVPGGADLASARVTLIESDQRKAAFLREVARNLGIAVDIESARIEFISTQANVESVDVVTSRALAPLPRLFELSRPFFSDRTTGLFLKGRTVEQEVADARRQWDFGLTLVPSLTDDEARLAVIRQLRSRREG